MSLGKKKRKEREGKKRKPDHFSRLINSEDTIIYVYSPVEGLHPSTGLFGNLRFLLICEDGCQTLL